ncbi:thrombospondin-type laminin G domain and EAR repeat-containing protein-like [Glandiceps talaboti]
MSDQIRAELYEIAYIADQQCDIMEDLGDFYEGAIADFDYMEMYQILDIAEPRYIEAFEMNGKPYLATTSYKDNSGDLCTKSTIYVLNDDNTRFEERWNLFTNGATRWHALTVKGVQHLIIANHGQQRCSDATNYVSYVYKYDASTDDFIKVQEIETYSAMDVDSAVINGEIYLAVANTESQPASSNDAEGFIFKYISTAKQFALEQRLTTGSVSIVEFVKINNKHFVVFAQGESADQGTIIYQFNNGSFQPFQDLETSHAKDISHFLSDDTTILVITEEQTLGQYDNILSYEVAVKFYEWSANSENFLQYEQVAVTAPSAVKVFQIGAFYYLGVVSSFEDQFTLYKYIGSSGWTEELLLNVDNVFGIETFEYDGETYIVLVTDTNAVIYHALKLGGNVSVNPELCDHDLLDQSWHDKALLP